MWQAVTLKGCVTVELFYQKALKIGFYNSHEHLVVKKRCNRHELLSFFTSSEQLILSDASNRCAWFRLSCSITYSKVSSAKGGA